MRKEATEKEIENSILDYLSYLPGLFWKNQTVGIFDQAKGRFRKPNNPYHMNGVADILGVINGMFVAIEVKRAKGRLTESQKVFLKRVKDNGGIAFVARSIDDVRENLTGIPTPRNFEI